ncbi:MAG: hypothetical protein CMD28_02050 [Flavobacteriales bacterium]|nr:hypothetical protein [Flavobacteriales bacterium]|tara:strand:- start:11 stop:298 length:288 start_codon:yes stop_codon:yes gene_type:complete
MDRELSIDYLKKLYVLLDRLMGETILGIKYVKSLRKGIESLQKNKLEVDNGTFKVNVKNIEDTITIDVTHANGEIIESLEFDSKSILNNNIIGKS